LSNLGSFAVNLQGYRFDDDHDSFADAQTITNSVMIAPGESVILVENMTPADFRNWWGSQNLPLNLQMIVYPKIGFSSDGDAIYLWNAATTATTDVVASITFSTATKAVSFGYDPAAGVFGGLSVVGQNGVFAAVLNGDIGSPGAIVSAPALVSAGFGANGFRLSVSTVPNLNYSVEYKNDLAGSNWLTLTNFLSTTTSFQLEDSAGTNMTRFYRVTVVP
jgi:hypothetical protein